MKDNEQEHKNDLIKINDIKQLYFPKGYAMEQARAFIPLTKEAKRVIFDECIKLNIPFAYDPHPEGIELESPLTGKKTKGMHGLFFVPDGEFYEELSDVL